MNIIEQDKIAIEILEQYFQTYKINPIYIPQDAFLVKGIDKGDIKLSLIRLEEKALIDKWEYATGYYEQTTDGEFYQSAHNKNPKKTELKWCFLHPCDVMITADTKEEEEMIASNYTISHYKIYLNLEKLQNEINKFQGNKKTTSKIKAGGYVKSIEILKSTGRIKIYINKNYLNELDFIRKKYWGMLYDLAENQSVDYSKGFFDYFNSNSHNPLYAKHGFVLTKILKQENNDVVPNIEIRLITQKKITQQLKTA
jgi:hypothetical protein